MKKEEISYDGLPPHCRDGMKRFIEDGILPGDFLQAVLQNDLVESACRADDVNIHRLLDYARFLYMYAPRPCWGSKEHMLNWHQLGGLNGIQSAREREEKDSE